jgi:uncharacterized protein YjbJ (UPF0337 family)
MNSLTELKGNWEETKDRLKKDFALINDNDLLFTDGRQDELIDRLHVKLGKTKEEVLTLLSGL